MWEKFKRDFVERFLTFETVKGSYLIPVGAVGFYLTLTAFQHVFQFAFFAVFAYLVVEGLRKVFVNRIKQTLKSEVLLQKRVDAMVEPENNVA